MKVLVINSGSSSIKVKLFDMERRGEVAGGAVENIGGRQSRIVSYSAAAGEAAGEQRGEAEIADHREGLSRIAQLLFSTEGVPVNAPGDIDAVGHRVVHGGEKFRAPVRIDEGVMRAIRDHAYLAPLHNPHNLRGIEVSRAIFPGAAQVAVFDTAFHQDLPPEAYLYALPYRLYEKEKVRRYGFHGTSHAFVAARAAEHLERPPGALNLITLHLGNGASMAAVRGGRCVDTTMGMTPLEGLVMGTRCGDIDPALPLFLAGRLNMSLEEIDRLLNRESGLKGLCGTHDMREVLDRRERGDRSAETAVGVYVHRVRSYIGAFTALLGRVDAVVFTAGVGENSGEIRRLCCAGLEPLGVSIDEELNRAGGKGVRDIGRPGGARILVIPTDEELWIAEETQRLLGLAH